MKRTPLNRKAPLQSRSQLKRSRMKPKSKKQSKLERLYRQPRAAFRGEFPICWFCQINVTTDVHEIANGPARSQAYGERSCWCASCNWCNTREVTNKRKWPIARQLAIKFKFDREYYNLDAFNEIRRGQRKTHRTEVILWICKELDRG